MSYDLLLAGVGGQGILMASRLLIDDALHRGQPCRGAETHGMAQRGGSVAAHVRLGPCHSALVMPGTAAVLLALDLTEGLRNLRYLRPGGRLLLQTKTTTVPTPVKAFLDQHQMHLRAVDGDRLVQTLGQPRALNVLMLGFAAAQPGTPFDLDGLRGAISRLLPARHVPINLQALALGHQAGQVS